METRRTPRAQAVGAYGERIAAEYLQAQGWRVIDRNWRMHGVGEIDIVAVDGRCLVVCEVKTRRTTHQGSPVLAVTPAKSARLRQLAWCWVHRHPDEVEGTHGVRVDVVGVYVPADGPAQITHLTAIET